MIWVQKFKKGFRRRHFSRLIPDNRKIFTDIVKAEGSLDENDSELTEFTRFSEESPRKTIAKQK